MLKKVRSVRTELAWLGESPKSLKFQRLRLFPGEVLVGEVAVLRRLVVDRLDQIQLLDNDTWSHVEVVADDRHQFVRRLLRGPVRLDEEGERLCHTNGVGELDKAATSELGVNERLGDPASKVGGAAVDFAVVFAAEGTTAVSAPAAVGVDDDFAAGQPCVALWAANDEEAGGLDLETHVSPCSIKQKSCDWTPTYVIDGLVIKILLGDGFLDNLLLDLLAQLLGGDVWAVLGADNNGIHSNRLYSTVIMLVLDRDLRLGIGPQPRARAVNPSLLHRRIELMRQLNCQRQVLWSLIRSISEHDTLITRTQLLQCLLVVQTLRDIWALLLDSHQHIAGLVIESLVRVVIANVFNRIADDSLVVDLRLGGDLAEDHDHAGLGGSLAGHLRERVIFEAGIEDGVGDLICDFVRVAFTD